MTTYKTEQENFWASEFGNEYISRNGGAQFLASNIAFFSKALAQTRGLESCIEFGANIGMNLRAVATLFPGIKRKAIEINAAAAAELGGIIGSENVIQGSILEADLRETFDLALIKGVLIHINPDALPLVYQKLYDASRRYILIAEYYNPSPVTISYRGHENKLFKRDFAGEFLEKFPDTRLLDYGFVYRRDPNFKQDDTTWFLIEKNG